jgi:hypothetical protein
MTEEQLRALLRLKRYEQPPDGYFDQLLSDIHRRQRTQLLNQPLWRIAWERLQTFFSEHSMGSVSYAATMAALLVLGIGSIGLLTPGANTVRPATSGPLARTQPRPPQSPVLSLEPGTRAVTNFAQSPAPTQNSVRPGANSSTHSPRYVIDARPASYEPSFSF